MKPRIISKLLQYKCTRAHKREHKYAPVINIRLESAIKTM